jgi:hypothetical protein
MVTKNRQSTTLPFRAGLPHIRAMLHLMKLAVGVRDVAHLREIQAARLLSDPPLRHRTRNRPRRAAEILDGGSMYWVIAGAMVVRQSIADIISSTWEDGSACAGLVLEPTLVPVAGRAVRAFQGWRYLAADAAPADVSAASGASGEDELPPALRAELRVLGLL